MLVSMQYLFMGKLSMPRQIIFTSYIPRVTRNTDYCKLRKVGRGKVWQSHIAINLMVFSFVSLFVTVFMTTIPNHTSTGTYFMA